MIPCLSKIEPPLNYSAFFGVWNQDLREYIIKKVFYYFIRWYWKEDVKTFDHWFAKVVRRIMFYDS